jgi:hypothetical protein
MTRSKMSLGERPHTGKAVGPAPGYDRDPAGPVDPEVSPGQLWPDGTLNPRVSESGRPPNPPCPLEQQTE